MLFDRKLKTQRDIEANIRFAADEGRAEGRAEGIEKGLKKGLTEGIIEGKLQTARSLLHRGIPIAEVAEITGLSVERLKES
jgi:predicted transposase/invertase (TIGR01784 family)